MDYNIIVYLNLDSVIHNKQDITKRTADILVITGMAASTAAPPKRCSWGSWQFPLGGRAPNTQQEDSKAWHRV